MADPSKVTGRGRETAAPAPRLAPLGRDEWTDETVRALGALADQDPLDNVFATLVRHPDLFRRYTVFGAHIMLKSTLSDRDRELAILRVARRRNCEYEFAQHARVGRAVGLTEPEIARVLDGPDAAGWTPREAAVLRTVDELVDTDTVGDATWGALAALFNDRQLLDLLFTIGTYSLVAWVLNALAVPLDRNLPPYPWPDLPAGHSRA
jgi:AhpD family alkylhydroperoxidase